MANEKPRVLIVDDQEGVRLTLEGIIADQGYNVTGVGSGHQAIQAVRETDFNVAFMDIRMPGLSGLETLKEIRKSSPETAVVMMTGYAADAEVMEALNEGAFSVIYKPFDPKLVLSMMQSAKPVTSVLVVDDRPASRTLLRGIIEDNGYDVAEASGGTEAIDMARQRHYDVVLMDIRMPDKDGLTAYEEIKEIDPEARVVFITGFPLDEDSGAALEVLANPVAFKPAQPADILSLIRKVAMGRSE